MLITDIAIRDRFILCVNELDLTLEEIAGAIGTHKPYLSALKKNKTPKVPSLLIANFCQEYGYSPYYIMQGIGPKKARAPKTREDKLLDIIEDLMNAMLELKPKWNDTHKELVNKAKKNVQ